MGQGMPIRFLILLSGDETEGGPMPELCISKIAPPYYLFRDVPADVVLASPFGGLAGVLGDRRAPAGGPEAVSRFLADREAREDLADTLRFDQIETEDFDAAFCIGLAGGPAGDLTGDLEGGVGPAERKGLASMMRSFLDSAKPVALVQDATVDLVPHDTGAGLLIVGSGEDSPILAAHALLSIVGERRRMKTGGGRIAAGHTEGPS